MNEITVFENEEFGSVRTLAIDGEPYFVARDVCDILGLKNTGQMLSRLEEDEKADIVLTDVSSNGTAQKRNFAIVNEPRLYGLVLASRKPEAKAFKRWITHEVLPAIRKTGKYNVRDSYTIEDPIERAKRWIEEEQERRQLESKVSLLTVSNETMRPKADYFDGLVDRGLLTNIRDTAKELHIRQKDFVKMLLDRKYMYRDKKGKLNAYAKYIREGLFEVKEFASQKTDFKGTQTLITPRGKVTFRLLTETEMNYDNN